MLCVLDVNLSQIDVLQTLSPSLSCLFTFLITSFDELSQLPPARAPITPVAGSQVGAKSRVWTLSTSRFPHQTRWPLKFLLGGSYPGESLHLRPAGLPTDPGDVPGGRWLPAPGSLECFAYKALRCLQSCCVLFSCIFF